MPEKQEEKLYLLLDSRSQPLARGQLLGGENAERLTIEVLDDQAEQVAEHDILQVISIDKEEPSRQCRLVQHRNARIVLEVMEVLDPEVRRNLRIPVDFESFIYPVSGKWKGRRNVRSVDLSCGGMAFYSDMELAVNETMEVVIPITQEPLIVHCQILRVQKLQTDRTFYASKFVDLCNDEEKTIRRAVFSVQVRDGRRRKNA